jgi:hypothetical protein
MTSRQYPSEVIIYKLREANVPVGRGQSIAAAVVKSNQLRARRTFLPPAVPDFRYSGTKKV